MGLGPVKSLPAARLFACPELAKCRSKARCKEVPEGTPLIKDFELARALRKLARTLLLIGTRLTCIKPFSRGCVSLTEICPLLRSR